MGRITDDETPLRRRRPRRRRHGGVPRFQVQDTLGHVDSSFTASVTVVIGTNPLGGRLSGTLSVAPVNGVALFGDLTIDKAGTGYTLNATTSGATGASSASFDVIATTP